MKTQVCRLAVTLLPLVLVIAGCTGLVVQPPAEPAPAQAPEPTPAVDPAAAIVLEMVERVNAEDYAAAAGYFADDAMVYFIGLPPSGMEIYRGKEQFRRMLEECCTGNHFLWQVTPNRVTNGVVYAEGETWLDFTRELGVAPNNFQEIFVIREGKIVTYWSVMDEEALAEFKPALASVMPPDEEPAPATAEPVSEITVAITDQTCAYTGPTVLQEGDLTVTAQVKDQNKEKFAITFFTLEPTRDFTDLMASTMRPTPPPWSKMISMREMAPGESLSYHFPVEAGPVYMVCWSGLPEMAIGQAGPFTVTQ